MYYTVVKVASEPSLKVPDQHCQDVGYFRGNTLFLYQYILSKSGIQYNSRWDSIRDSSKSTLTDSDRSDLLSRIRH